MREWSKYQEAIFNFNLKPGNGLINAVAGSGKTTVVEQCIRQVPESESVLACAFNRHIKKSLEQRLADPVAGRMTPLTINTLNGFGYAVCRDAVKRYIKINGDKSRNTLKFDVLDGAKDKPTTDLFYKSQRGICRLIGLLKSYMIWYPTDADVERLMEDFDIKVAKGVDRRRFIDITKQTYDLCLNKTTVMDFDDQKAMPIFHDWEVPHYDRIYVDEAQDLSPLEIELLKRTTPNKAIFVGDPRQAIYQFRGADSHAIANIIESFECQELPLSVCYRCAQTIVRRAQDQVKHIEAHDAAPEGHEATVSLAEYRDTVRDGDIILCRTTAPLVEECLEMIRRGRKATVKGRDIGAQLVDFIDEVGGDDRQDAVTFIELAAYYIETRMPSMSDERAGILQDKYDTVKALADRGGTVGDIKKMISKIFDDDAETGLVYMTGHKAKGLEATTVYILRPDLIPHKYARTEEQIQAEYNLLYVMITRAMLNLFWISNETPKSE